MAFNQIQFQHGMSIPEFLRSFGTEAQCAEAIKAARWPEGFRCPRCASSDHYVVGHGVRKLFQCKWLSASDLPDCGQSHGTHQTAADDLVLGHLDRFNSRFDLRGMVASLIVDVVRAKPIKEKQSGRMLRRISSQVIN